MSLLKYVLSIELGGTGIKALLMVEAKLETSFSSFQNIQECLQESTIINQKTSTNPEETIRDLSKQILESIEQNAVFSKVAISSFGPVGVSKNRSDYGQLFRTPKAGWSYFKLIDSLSENLSISKDLFIIETDVNSPANLEYRFGNHEFIDTNNNTQKVSSLAYITIGTGCGVGVLVDGHLIHGLLHTEGGHIRLQRHANDTNHKGVCCYHNDCAEGLITNVSIKERKGLETVDEVEKLPDEDEVWDYFSFYVAQVCLNLVYLINVEKIIIGGGIINRESLLPKIRNHFLSLNNGYINHPMLTEDNIDKLIIRTEFKNGAGLLGGLSLLVDTSS